VITHRQAGAGYKPKTKQDALDLKTAGATNIYLGAKEARGKQKHEFSVEQTSREALSDLQTNNGSKKAYDRSARLYNQSTKSKNVAWWDEGKGLLNLEGTEFVTIPPDKIKEGVTPLRIQNIADASGKSVKEILQELGIKVK